MKKSILSLYGNWRLRCIPIALFAVAMISCNPEIVDPDPPSNSVGPDKFLMTYWSDNASTGNNYYEPREITSVPGPGICNEGDMGKWQCMVGVQAGPFQ